MSFPSQPNKCPGYYTVKNPTFCGMSPRQKLAAENNDAFYKNNKAHRDRPHGENGHTYGK